MLPLEPSNGCKATASLTVAARCKHRLRLRSGERLSGTHLPTFLNTAQPSQLVQRLTPNGPSVTLTGVLRPLRAIGQAQCGTLEGGDMGVLRDWGAAHSGEAKRRRAEARRRKETRPRHTAGARDGRGRGGAGGAPAVGGGRRVQRRPAQRRQVAAGQRGGSGGGQRWLAAGRGDGGGASHPPGKHHHCAL